MQPRELQLLADDPHKRLRGFDLLCFPERLDRFLGGHALSPGLSWDATEKRSQPRYASLLMRGCLPGRTRLQSAGCGRYELILVRNEARQGLRRFEFLCLAEGLDRLLGCHGVSPFSVVSCGRDGRTRYTAASYEPISVEKGRLKAM